MKRKPSYSRLLAVACIAAAFGFGYLASHRSKSSRESSGDLQSDAGYGHEGVSSKGEDRDFNRNKSWSEVKTRVLDRWRASPSVVVDFDLHEETLRLLENTPVADLDGWMRELRPISDTDWDKDIPDLMREMIMKVLVKRCGSDFVRSLADHPLDDASFDLSDVMDYWLKHDPKTVLEWLESGNPPKEVADDFERYQEDAIQELPKKHPEEFERRIALMDAHSREIVLEWHSYRMGDTENRAGLLERAAKSPHGEAIALYDGLLRREAESNPRRAVATLQGLVVSEDDRGTLDDRLVSGAMTDLRLDASSEDRSPVLQGWVERNPNRRVPTKLLEEFGTWSQNDPERALAWVAKQASGFQYDAMAKQLFGNYAQTSEKNLTEWVDIASRIGDSDIRAEANRILKKEWETQNPKNIADWEKKRSAEDRERLSREHSDE